MSTPPCACGRPHRSLVPVMQAKEAQGVLQEVRDELIEAPIGSIDSELLGKILGMIERVI